MKKLISLSLIALVFVIFTGCTAEQKLAWNKGLRSNNEGSYTASNGGGYLNTYDSKGAKSGKIYVPYSGKKGGYYKSYDSKGKKSGSIYVPYSGKKGGYYKTYDSKGKKSGSVYVPYSNW